MIRSAARYLGLIKFEHTLFALPFALISLLVASAGRPALHVLLWVLVAMVAARSAAMAFNRLADRKYDRRNPRTANRHLPAGLVSVRGAAVFTAASAVLFVLAASRLNTLCFALSPLALAVVLLYSFTKRFTAASHLVLGLGLAIAPVGAWLAVTGRFAAFPLWISAGVLFWVAGFDTIYGCQDIDFDGRMGLQSLAARLGSGAALNFARVFHVLAVLCFGMAISRSAALGYLAAIGVGVVALLLIWEQWLVKDGDLQHIDRAFFTINSWIGMILLVCVALDLYWI